MSWGCGPSRAQGAGIEAVVAQRVWEHQDLPRDLLIGFFLQVRHEPPSPAVEEMCREGKLCTCLASPMASIPPSCPLQTKHGAVPGLQQLSQLPSRTLGLIKHYNQLQSCQIYVPVVAGRGQGGVGPGVAATSPCCDMLRWLCLWMRAQFTWHRFVGGGFCVY